MAYVGGNEFGSKLETILGLPKHTKGFELRCYVNEVVTIKCEYYPEIDNVEQLISIFKEYKLVEVEEEDKDVINNNSLT